MNTMEFSATYFFSHFRFSCLKYSCYLISNSMWYVLYVEMNHIHIPNIIIEHMFIYVNETHNEDALIICWRRIGHCVCSLDRSRSAANTSKQCSLKRSTDYYLFVRKMHLRIFYKCVCVF